MINNINIDTYWYDDIVFVCLLDIVQQYTKNA